MARIHSIEFLWDGRMLEKVRLILQLDVLDDSQPLRAVFVTGGKAHELHRVLREHLDRSGGSGLYCFQCGAEQEAGNEGLYCEPHCKAVEGER